MKGRRWTILVIALAAFLVWVLWRAPKHPMALIRVQDRAGNPIQGATIKSDGLRTKPGPYNRGHYRWPQGEGIPENREHRTDKDGRALVPYPKYVFEKIETGQISFQVSHPDFVHDRPFREVSTAPPAGAPWPERLNYLVARVKSRTIVVRTDPIMLDRGAIVIVRGERPAGLELFSQISGTFEGTDDFWTRLPDGAITSRRVPPGPQTVRLVGFDPSGAGWFGDVTNITAVAEQTNELRLDLRRGMQLRGRLDDTVPLPVTRGRVIAEISPAGSTRQSSPPGWHNWPETAADGSFVFSSMPAGDLEISAICDGFISTNGPGQFSLKYPQKHSIGTNDLDIIIGMEPTIRLEATVLDTKSKPVKGATISTWPNIRYGEWSATIFAGDCYRTAELMREGPKTWQRLMQTPPDFSGVTDESGVAVLPNLPIIVKSFALDHPEYQLPVVDDGSGHKSRHGAVQLTPGQTNRINIIVEPRGSTTITHY